MAAAAPRGPPPPPGSLLWSWFRSTDMTFLSMVIQEDLAHACVTELGRLGTVQLLDLNPNKTAFQRRYVAEISRIDVMERRLRFFFDTLAMFDVEPVPAPSSDDLLDALALRTQQGLSPAMLLSELEQLLVEREQEIRTLRGFSAQLTQELNAKIELKHVLEKTRAFARDDPNIPQDAQSAGAEFDVGGNPMLAIRFRFLAGTVESSRRANFERMIFRTTRGNSYVRFTEIEDPILDPVKNQPTQRSVFIIFYQAQVIEQKLKNVCSWYEARTYDIPNIDSSAEIAALIASTQQEIGERQLIVRKNRTDMNRALSDLARQVNRWKLTLVKEKATYHSMNLMMADVAGVLRAEGWVISTQVDQVADVIAAVHRRTSTKTLPNWVTVVPEGQRGKLAGKPPTHFYTNKFTEAFQLLVDTYGVAQYKEVNPAVLSAITFPFCFGIMFGDVGHGTWLFIFALFLVLRERSLAKLDMGEVGNMLFAGRYVLLLMSIFSVYAGFIYNDVMALGVSLFDVTWAPTNQTGDGGAVIYSRGANPTVYPWGADPTWRIATNEIGFYNSFKMKFAVIFGVIHMTIGLGFNAANAVFYHRGKSGPNLDLWFEAIPQIVFMLLLFGYMDFLIVYKWSIPWGSECTRTIGCNTPPCPLTCQPPSLITTLISMVLTPGTVQYPLFENQGGIQLLLVLIALLMVPIMLCVKPCVLIRRIQAKKRLAAQQQGGMGGHHHHAGHGHGASGGLSDDPHEGLVSGATVQRGGAGAGGEHDHGDDDDHDEEEHGVGDIVVHQGIETIEFVLGGISNTASYLRLWALSLAHSQLAAVFWERTLLVMLLKDGAGGVVGTYVACAVFLAVTFGVLMAMDNLECFLHSCVVKGGGGAWCSETTDARVYSLALRGARMRGCAGARMRGCVRGCRPGYGCAAYVSRRGLMRRGRGAREGRD